MLERIGTGAARHHWWVIGIWVVVAVAAVAAAGAFGGHPVDSFSVPNTDSQQALDVLEERFPEAAGGSATVVFYSPGGDRGPAKVTDPDARKAIEATVAKIKELPDLASVADPFVELPPPLPRDVNPTGQIAFTSVSFTKPVTQLPRDTFDRITEAAEPARKVGLSVAYGGPVVDLQDTTNTSGGISEHADDIGLGFAVVILLVAMGAVVAMIVPIASALVGLVVSAALLQLAMGWFTISTVSPALGTMIGLGVGIDYALFITSRYRQNLSAGNDPITAAGRANALSGSAVLFAGITVCLALAGLYLVGIPYITTLGLAMSLFVAVAVVAAVTLIPAILGLAGHRINALRIHRRDDQASDSGLSARWGRTVVRRPWPFAIGGLVILLLLAVPLTRMQLNFPDAGDDAPGATQRVAYDKLAEGFGPGVNAPLLVVVELPKPTEANVGPELEAALKLVEALSKTDGVANAVGPIPNQDGTAAIVSVTPTTGPADPATTALVTKLRDTTIPDALEGTAIKTSQVSVGGSTASLIDLTTLLGERLPWFIGGVVLAAFVLLMMVFRSLLVPLKAAVMNLLSIGAAYGVLVAVFQWGWLRDLVALQETIPVAPFIPVMMFAILFGLSMDYEVFLLSRMREEWQLTGDAELAVINGLANTARVITSAALIMITVFLAFVTNPSPVIKMMAFGMAIAVFIDATLVRMVLVPAVMRLFGRSAWWLPHWLDRILPRINVDATPRQTADQH